jgi:hypothetical protein
MERQEQSPAADQHLSTPGRRTRLLSLLLAGAGLVAGGAAIVVYALSEPTPVPQKKAPIGAAWSYDEYFPDWPKDRKPEFVIIITGQTYGYLQKCGCSDPQKGGLERRFNFIAGFKAQGIEVVPIDLGDVSPEVTAPGSRFLPQQAVLKYATAMTAMKDMGYRVVGLGKQDFALGLDKIHGEYSLQKGNELPRILAANLSGSRIGASVVPKDQVWPDAKGGGAIHDWEIIPTKSRTNLGVVGVVGHAVIEEVKKLDQTVVFADNSEKIVASALKEMGKRKDAPQLSVLLYSGPLEGAKLAAARFPEFPIVVCGSEEAEPSAPVYLPNGKKIGKSMIVRVGHRGQNVGVIGVFKEADGTFALKYQSVTMMPGLETPDGQENPALRELDRYAKAVRDRHYLTLMRKSAHPSQVVNTAATYVGSEKCIDCHKDRADNSAAMWNASKHAHAYKSLETVAKRPSLRQFDGECIRCHTVGYDFKSGFEDAVKTPHLMNVGCESCHGPGSAHSEKPDNKALALEMSPWQAGGLHVAMPDAELLKEYAQERERPNSKKVLSDAQVQLLNRVFQTCFTCHNTENDPHFKLETFWPKIAHSKNPPPPKKVIGNGNDKAPKEKEGPVFAPPLPLPKS